MSFLDLYTYQDEGRRPSEPRMIAASAAAGTLRETPTSGAKTNWGLAEKAALVAPGRDCRASSAAQNVRLAGN